MQHLRLLAIVGTLLVTSVGFTFFAAIDPGVPMSERASALVKALDAEQKQTAVLAYGTPEQVGWHFIPKDYRKGLQIKEMSEQQQDLTHQLLRSALSEMGYTKATKIMELEKLLNQLEAGRGRWARDYQRYYVTFFGEPTATGKWGFSFEGHHLSLNFVVENGKLISSTPQFFATNPAVVRSPNTVGIPIGTRVLALEETLAFELVQSLSPEQLKQALIAEKAFDEIRDAGSPQPPQTAPEGIRYDALNEAQQKLLWTLIEEYANAAPGPVAQQRLAQVQADGVGNIHFAWAGATEPGIGHYYRVQSPAYLIELVNTQPDAAGNPANHIHSVWRDLRGDFAIPIKK